MKLTSFFGGGNDRARIEPKPVESSNFSYMSAPTLASKILSELVSKFGNSLNERPVYTKLLFK